jgi:hypothetical protein
MTDGLATLFPPDTDVLAGLERGSIPIAIALSVEGGHDNLAGPDVELRPTPARMNFDQAIGQHWIRRVPTRCLWAPAACRTPWYVAESQGGMSLCV